MPSTIRRVLIVDDSRFFRRLLRQAIDRLPGLEVCGAVATAEQALNFVREHGPDLVTMDVEMPGESGLRAVEQIMRIAPVRIVMVSSFTVHGADAALSALSLGAVDVIEKPRIGVRLPQFIAQLGSVLRASAYAHLPKAPDVTACAAPKRFSALRHNSVIAIGGSTGAIEALNILLSGLAPPFPAVVVAQHLPKGFSERLARRLARQSGLDVAIAADRAVLSPSRVLVIPAGMDGQIMSGRLRLSPSAPDAVASPSSDILFQTLGRSDLAIVLSGMGQDAAAGLIRQGRDGPTVVVQSPESCVMESMPQATLARVPTATKLTPPQIAVFLSGICKDFGCDNRTIKKEKT